MLCVASATFAALALSHCALAASNSIVATPTALSIPTNTYCPLLNPVETTAPGQICRQEGGLSKPSTALSHSCWNRDPRSCYRACAKDPKCLSFSLDIERNLCTSYGQSLTDMQFYDFGASSVLYSDFPGCYVCNSTLDQKTSFCPNTPTRIKPPLDNYTCGVGGTFEDDHVVFRYAGATFNDCYGYCARLDQYGGCSSFSWDTQGRGNHSRCHIFLRSLRQKGFMAVEGAPQAWSLRGCFECNDSTPPVDPCFPPDFPPSPRAPNGNFSRTYYDALNRVTLPRDWYVDYANNTRAVTGPRGNTYIRMSADGSHRNGAKSSAYLGQAPKGFNQDPSSPDRFYNLTFDIALKQYDVPLGGWPCKFSHGLVLNPTEVTLDPLTFPKTLTTRGPFLIDVASYYPQPFTVQFTLFCHRTQGGRLGGNATVRFDNVKWSQHGREIGNV